MTDKSKDKIPQKPVELREDETDKVAGGRPKAGGIYQGPGSKFE